jgi:hypothetical protein
MGQATCPLPPSKTSEAGASARLPQVAVHRLTHPDDAEGHEINNLTTEQIYTADPVWPGGGAAQRESVR